MLGHQVKQGLAPGVFHFVPDANQHTTQTPGYSVIVHLYIHVGKSQPQSVWPQATCDTTQLQQAAQFIYQVPAM